MTFVDWLTVLGVSANSVLQFIRNKLKMENADYDMFARSLRNNIKAACDSYRQYKIYSHDYKDDFFPEEYDNIIYQSILDALLHEKPFTIDMMLPNEELSKDERKKIYNIIERTLSHSLEYATRDFFAWVKSSSERTSEDIKQLKNILINLIEDTNKVTNYKNSFSEYIDNIVHLREEICADLSIFDYRSDKISFFGREKEQNAIKEFCDSEESFSWWIVSGCGGSGKSRLLLQYAIKNAHDMKWKICQIPHNFFTNKVYSNYKNYSYDKNLLLVVDYAGKFSMEISLWFDAIISLRKTLSAKIRVILIERSVGEELNASITHDLEQNYIMEYNFGNKKKQRSMMLTRFSPNEIYAFCKSIIENLTHNTPTHEDLLKICEIINEIDPLETRALFLIILCSWFSENGSIEGESIVDIIDKIIRKERQQVKNLFRGDEIEKENCMIAYYKLLSYATISGDINLSSDILPYYLQEAKNCIYRNIPKHSERRNIFLLNGSNRLTDDVVISSYTPDIIGEYMAITTINDYMHEEIKQVILDSLHRNKEFLLHFVIRSFLDFYKQGDTSLRKIIDNIGIILCDFDDEIVEEYLFFRIISEENNNLEYLYNDYLPLEKEEEVRTFLKACICLKQIWDGKVLSIEKLKQFANYIESCNNKHIEVIDKLFTLLIMGLGLQEDESPIMTIQEYTMTLLCNEEKYNYLNTCVPVLVKILYCRHSDIENILIMYLKLIGRKPELQKKKAELISFLIANYDKEKFILPFIDEYSCECEQGHISNIDYANILQQAVGNPNIQQRKNYIELLYHEVSKDNRIKSIYAQAMLSYVISNHFENIYCDRIHELFFDIQNKEIYEELASFEKKNLKYLYEHNKNQFFKNYTFYMDNMDLNNNISVKFVARLISYVSMYADLTDIDYYRDIYCIYHYYPKEFEIKRAYTATCCNIACRLEYEDGFKILKEIYDILKLGETDIISIFLMGLRNLAIIGGSQPDLLTIYIEIKAYLENNIELHVLYAESLSVLINENNLAIIQWVVDHLRNYCITYYDARFAVSYLNAVSRIACYAEKDVIEALINDIEILITRYGRSQQVMEELIKVYVNYAAMTKNINKEYVRKKVFDIYAQYPQSIELIKAYFKYRISIQNWDNEEDIEQLYDEMASLYKECNNDEEIYMDYVRLLSSILSYQAPYFNERHVDQYMQLVADVTNYESIRVIDLVLRSILGLVVVLKIDIAWSLVEDAYILLQETGKFKVCCEIFAKILYNLLATQNKWDNKQKRKLEEYIEYILLYTNQTQVALIFVQIILKYISKDDKEIIGKYDSMVKEIFSKHSDEDAFVNEYVMFLSKKKEAGFFVIDELKRLLDEFPDNQYIKLIYISSVLEQDENVVAKIPEIEQLVKDMNLQELYNSLENLQNEIVSNKKKAYGGDIPENYVEFKKDVQQFKIMYEECDFENRESTLKFIEYGDIILYRHNKLLERISQMQKRCVEQQDNSELYKFPGIDTAYTYCELYCKGLGALAECGENLKHLLSVVLGLVGYFPIFPHAVYLFLELLCLYPQKIADLNIEKYMEILMKIFTNYQEDGYCLACLQVLQTFIAHDIIPPDSSYIDIIVEYVQNKNEKPQIMGEYCHLLHEKMKKEEVKEAFQTLSIIEHIYDNNETLINVYAEALLFYSRKLPLNEAKRFLRKILKLSKDSENKAFLMNVYANGLMELIEKQTCKQAQKTVKEIYNIWCQYQNITLVFIMAMGRLMLIEDDKDCIHTVQNLVNFIEPLKESEQFHMVFVSLGLRKLSQFYSFLDPDSYETFEEIQKALECIEIHNEWTTERKDIIELIAKGILELLSLVHN